MNTQTYVINIRAGSAMAPKVKVSQGDVGRILSFKIFDGAFAFTPAQGSTVTITGTKPSGLGFTETCTLSGNTATVSTTLDMTQESGDMLAELRIANGSASIGSVNFVLSVERAPHQDGTTDGTYDTMDDIQTQIGDLSELATSEKSSLVGAINEAAQSGGSEITVDDTLTTAGAAADAKKTGDEISGIKADLGDLSELETETKTDLVSAINEAAQSGGGLSEDVKAALLQLAQKVAYIDDDGQDYYDDLYNALYPPAGLVSISAVYTQSGTVYDTDTLDSLKSDLVVTAHMSDSTTQTVTTYTLSGTLAEGTSTIIVTYSGKTTTFNVTVTEKPPATMLYSWDFTSSLTDSVQGSTANTTATQDSNGLSFSENSRYLELPSCYQRDRTYEIDVASIVRDGSGNYGRLFIIDGDSNTGSGGSGYIITGSAKGGDKFYINGAWEVDVIIPESQDADGSFYSGSTVGFYVDDNGYVSVYKNGTLLGTSATAMPTSYNGQNVYIGGNIADHLKSSRYTGYRIYDGNAYE